MSFQLNDDVVMSENDDIMIPWKSHFDLHPFCSGDSNLVKYCILWRSKNILDLSCLGWFLVPTMEHMTFISITMKKTLNRFYWSFILKGLYFIEVWNNTFSYLLFCTVTMKPTSLIMLCMTRLIRIYIIHRYGWLRLE